MPLRHAAIAFSLALIICSSCSTRGSETDSAGGSEQALPAGDLQMPGMASLPRPSELYLRSTSTEHQELQGSEFDPELPNRGVTVEIDAAQIEAGLAYMTYVFSTAGLAPGGAGELSLDAAGESPLDELLDSLWIAAAHWPTNRWQSFPARLNAQQDGLKFSFPDLASFAHPDDGRVIAAVISTAQEPWTLHTIGLDATPWFVAPVPGASAAPDDYWLVDAGGYPGLGWWNETEGGFFMRASDIHGAFWDELQRPYPNGRRLRALWSARERLWAITEDASNQSYLQHSEDALAEWSAELTFLQDPLPDDDTRWFPYRPYLSEADKAAIAWFADSVANPGVGYRAWNFHDPETWGPPVQVTAETPDYLSDPMLVDGKPALLWELGGLTRYYSAGYADGSFWLSPIDVNLNGCLSRSLLAVDGKPAIIARFAANGSVYFCLNSETDGSGAWSFDLAAQATQDVTGSIIDGKPALVISRQQLIDGKYICSLTYKQALTVIGSDWGPEEEIDSYSQLEEPTVPYNWSGPVNLGADGAAGVAFIRGAEGYGYPRIIQFAGSFRF